MDTDEDEAAAAAAEAERLANTNPIQRLDQSWAARTTVLDRAQRVNNDPLAPKVRAPAAYDGQTMGNGQKRADVEREGYEWYKSMENKVTKSPSSIRFRVPFRALAAAQRGDSLGTDFALLITSLPIVGYALLPFTLLPDFSAWNIAHLCARSSVSLTRATHRVFFSMFLSVSVCLCTSSC
jgi:hypothetical protein